MNPVDPMPRHPSQSSAIVGLGQHLGLEPSHLACRRGFEPRVPDAAVDTNDSLLLLEQALSTSPEIRMVDQLIHSTSSRRYPTPPGCRLWVVETKRTI